MKEIKNLILLGFLGLFLLSSSSAQATLDTNSIISSLPGIILILVFILILLWLGGVVKFGGGRISWFFIIFIVGIILLFVIPQFVPYPTYLEVPESFKAYPLPSYASQFLEMLGLPSEWMYVPAIIYLFILPFAGIYTLVWAFLVSIKIFEGVPSSVNRILAFVITFLTIPVGWFTKIVWIVFSFLGIWSVVIFGITFIFAIFFRGYGVVEEERYKSMSKKWREQAKKYLQNALIDIQNHQAGSAQNNLNGAEKISGFSTNYYNNITQAKNALSENPPNWATAENAVKNALKEIS